MTGGMRYIGVDAGGHTISAAAVDFSSSPPRLCSAITIDTPADRGLSSLLSAVSDITLRLARGCDSCRVGVGLPGFIDKERLRVRRLTNFHGCDGLPLGMMIAERLAEKGLHAPVSIENDANCAALGEGLAGEAAGLSDYVVLTLGTGVGAGIVADGRLLRGAHGMAAECGHIAVCEGDSLCGCGGVGHLERAASADWLEGRAKEAGLPGDFKKLWGARGESRAAEIIEPALEALARGIASVCATLDPEAVIISGGMARAEGLAAELSARAEKYLSAPFRDSFELRVSKLGGEAAVIGAASLPAGEDKR